MGCAYGVSRGLELNNPCGDAGYTIGDPCPLNMEKPAKCATQTCTITSCASTNQCLCLPSNLDCPTDSGGGKACDGKTCPSDSLWTNTSLIVGPYQQQKTYKLNLITCECETKTKYRCQSGYYQTGIASAYEKPTCTKCPTYPDSFAQLDALGSVVNSQPGTADAATDCYISANTQLADDTGTYIFQNQNCYYKE